MCPPKPPKTQVVEQEVAQPDPAPTKTATAPEISAEGSGRSSTKAGASRNAKRRGISALRIDLAIPESSGNGLAIPVG